MTGSINWLGVILFVIAILVLPKWASVMRRQPVKDFGVGVPSHYIAVDRLNPIPRLLERLFNMEEW